DTAATLLYTLSLHDALPIYCLLGVEQIAALGLAQVLLQFLQFHLLFVRIGAARLVVSPRGGFELAHGQLAPGVFEGTGDFHFTRDRKSTRLNSSHVSISYAV